jgi:hypothetical protein
LTSVLEFSFELDRSLSVCFPGCSVNFRHGQAGTCWQNPGG